MTDKLPPLGFEKWLRTVCLQKPTPEAYDLAKDAWQQAVREAVPEGFVLVSAEFMRGFRTLAHNYSLKAVPPFYYHGVEGSAFSAAYDRCGRDLALLLAAAKEAK